MAKNKLSFDAIFEGNDIKEDAKKRISAMLEDVVATRMEAHDDEEDEDDEDDDTEVVKEAKDRILIRGKVGGSAYEYVADPDKLGGSVDNKYERLTIKKQNPGLQPAAIDAIIAHLDNEDYDENGFESTEGQFKVTSSSKYMSEAMDPTVDDEQDQKDPEAEDEMQEGRGKRILGVISSKIKDLFDKGMIKMKTFSASDYKDFPGVKSKKASLGEVTVNGEDYIIIHDGVQGELNIMSTDLDTPEVTLKVSKTIPTSEEMDPEAKDEEVYEEDDADAATNLKSQLSGFMKDPELLRAFRVGFEDPTKAKLAIAQMAADLKSNPAASPATNFVLELLNWLADKSNAVNMFTQWKKQQNASPDPMTSADDGPINNEYSEAFTNKLDKYLTYVAEEWAENNKIALENGIKVQIAESFLSNMKGMYEQYNFTNIPTRDMVVELGTKVTEAEQKLNEQIEKNAQLRIKYNKQRKQMLVLESSKGLTATQVEKFKKLTEDVAFEDEKSFKNKVAVIKENAFTKTVVKSDTKLETETGPQGELLHENTRMSKYVDTISRSLKF